MQCLCTVASWLTALGNVSSVSFVDAQTSSSLLCCKKKIKAVLTLSCVVFNSSINHLDVNFLCSSFFFLLLLLLLRIMQKTPQSFSPCCSWVLLPNLTPSLPLLLTTHSFLFLFFRKHISVSLKTPTVGAVRPLGWTHVTLSFMFFRCYLNYLSESASAGFSQREISVL